MKRYKVKAPDDATFRAVADVARKHATVRLEMPTRRTLAIDSIDSQCLQELQRAGARVSEEVAYDME